MKSLSRGRWTLQYTDTGKATRGTVILLHGFPGGIQTWVKVVPHLIESGFRVILPLQRGYSEGQQPARICDYSVRLLVDDIKALVSHEEIERAHIVGHDWGGVIGWLLATRYPQMVESLSAVSAPHPRAFLQSLLISNQLQLSSYMVLFQAPRMAEWWLLRKGGEAMRSSLRSSGLSEEFESSYVNSFLRNSKRLSHALNWYRALPFSAGSLLAAGQAVTPVLFAYGEKDKFLSRAAANLTYKWAAGSYRELYIPDGTHWLPEEYAEVLSSAILEFVDDIVASPSKT